VEKEKIERIEKYLVCLDQELKKIELRQEKLNKKI